MGSTKKDLEIVYNLQWKNNPGHLNDKANIVAMCDIPATTLNWETFKSYLLDFQIALYSFRQRARTGGIITLKLDCVSDTSRNGPIKRLRRMIDKPAVEVAVATVPEDETPDWFKRYMKEFKKEVIDEVTSSVLNAVSNIKQNTCYHARKSKFDCCKRQRKNSFGINLAEINEKELIKSLKLERKLDNKLEKLEQKTIKIKEKKMALQTNDGSAEFQIPIDIKSEIDNISVSIVGKHEVFIPHMLGGETYQHEWDVVNSGTIEWSSATELRYAWGSETVKPVTKVVPCPPLKPQEKGTVSICVEIPRKPGTYESYWYFYHEGRRLGQWIGCLFCVDPTPFNTLSPNMEKPNEIILPPLHFNTSTPKKLKLDSSVENGDNILDVSQNLQSMALNDENQFDSCVGSESEPQSLISMGRSISSLNSAPSDEFVVLRLPQNDDKEDDKPEESVNVCIPLQNLKVEKIESVSVKDEPVDQHEDDNNNTEITNACDEEPINRESQYAYVNYNGEKIAIPKTFLRPDFLATAEDAPDPSMSKSQENGSPNMSNSTMENKSRLFVFPLNCPGFEVVYPTNVMAESLNLHLNESCESTQTSMTERNNIYPPNPFPFAYGNVSMSSSYTGNGSECIRCNPLSYTPNVYPQLNYAHDFNHSKCGGQYCQQFVNREKTSETSCSTPSTNLPRYPQTPTVHENIPSAPHRNIQAEANAVSVFPDQIMSGAVNVASSAINTARTVLNMFTTKTEQGRWQNGHWITTDPNSPREKALKLLYEMGFWDRDLNATLLARYNDDVQRVISELLQ
ncbi:hypothetical protein FQR65_LT09019 [Abscondita terminalis]|nr:hypothetical protein FQR65_LT09019 [Abscondita terminalis]